MAGTDFITRRGAPPTRRWSRSPTVRRPLAAAVSPSPRARPAPRPPPPPPPLPLPLHPPQAPRRRSSSRTSRSGPTSRCRWTSRRRRAARAARRESKSAGEPVEGMLQKMGSFFGGRRKSMAVPQDGKTEVWRIENFEAVPLDQSLYGQFFAGDSYIVKYTYKEGSKECYLIYFWQGAASTADEKGASALLAKNMDDQLGGAATQVRVVMGKEPSHFVRLFKGKMVIHSAARRRRSRTPPTPTVRRRRRLAVLRARHRRGEHAGGAGRGEGGVAQRRRLLRPPHAGDDVRGGRRRQRDRA